MKKKISILLICLLILSILPIEQFISFAGTSSFEPDLIHTREWFEQGSSEAQGKLEEAESYLNTIGVEKRNEKNQILNVITFAMYGVAVYGYPHGDKKTPAQFDELKREEYRYLGYDVTGKNDVTNTYFPEDATSTNQDLLTKDWRTQSGNYASWSKADNDNNIVEYILTTHGLAYNGEEIPYTLSEIIGITNIDTLKDYINLQSIPKFSIWGSVRLYSMGGDGVLRYRTFLVPPLAGDKTLEANITTDEDEYIIERNEDYIDIPITVSGKISTSDSFLESYIADRWVEFDGTKKSGESYTFTKRIYKNNLEEGANEIVLTGDAGIKSSFEGDSPILDEASKEITIIVQGEEDKLVALLDLPKSAGINEEYTVSDVSYIPEGATVISSTLKKKVGTAREEEVPTWSNSTKSITESSPVMNTITYTLTILLDNGQVDSDTKSINITDVRNVDATADLELDSWTYEGHPTYARDVSVFDVEGETYNAVKAYEENLAHNHFDVVESTSHTLKRLSDTKARIVFNETGWYNVELEVETKDNEELFDREAIEVRKTPYIEAFIGGTQKENRKQILSISSAIHPDYPLTNFWVELEDTDTGEKVHLTSSKVNSNHIKTRDIQSEASEYFHNYTLEFLTKNETEKVYKYTVYVKDSKGDTDQVSDYFTVYPDLTPVAQLDMLDSFLRNENSNIAEIIAEDGTVSVDGDQVERTWTVAFDTDHDNSFADETYTNIASLGYEDLSFGTKQKVKFNKTGVGKANVRLDVKEVWVEPTLEEYVTDADRLTGYITDTTEILNVAPMVSVEPINAHPVEILLLATQSNFNSVKNNLSTLETLLKENKIDAKINLQVLDNMASMSSGSTFTATAPLQTLQFNNHMILVDNKHLYRVIPSGVDASYNAIYPYKIQALNIETGSVAWSYSMGMTDDDFTIKQDDQNKYLYVIKENNTTLLLNKSTGALVGALSFVVDGSIYATDENIYWFTDTEIKKYNIASGALTTVANEGNDKTYMVNGKVAFVSIDKYNKPFRGIFELDTDEFEREYIEMIDKNKESLTMIPFEDTKIRGFEVIDIDNYGTTLIQQELYHTKYSGTFADDGDCIYWVISPDNKVIKTVLARSPRLNSDDFNAGLIKDEKGKAKHFFYGVCEFDDDDVHTYVYEIYGNRSVSHSASGNYNMYPHFGVDNGEYLYILIGGNYYDANNTYTKRGYTLRVRVSDYTASSVSGIFDSSYDEDYDVSDLYAGTVYDNGQRRDNVPNTQYVKAYRFEQTLDDLLERAIHKNARFSEDAQKYVIVLDNMFYSNTTLPQGVIDKLKSEGIYFTYIGENISSNPNSYGSKIISSTKGTKIEYENNMELNFTRISTLLESLIDKIKNSVKLSTQTSDTIRLRKIMQLEPSSEYEYEYDIKYSKDYTSINKNALRISNGSSNVSNYGLSLSGVSQANISGYAYLEDVLYEDFNGPYVNPKLELIEYGSYPFTKSYGMFARHDFRGKTTHSGAIKFNMEKDGFILFDIRGEMSANDYVDTVIEDNGTEIFRADSDVGFDLYPYNRFMFYCSAGQHEILVSGRSDRSDTNDTWIGIDNFEIKYINRGTADSGEAPETRTSAVKADTWYDVQSRFRTKAKQCELVNIPGGRMAVENWSDASLQPIVTGTFGLEFNGNAVTPSTSNYSSSRITLTVPEGHIVNVKFNASKSADDYETYFYYEGSNGNHKYRNTYDHYFDMDLMPGEHTFGAYLKYERRDKNRYAKLTIQDMTITDKGYPTSNGQNYFVRKESNNNTTLDLLFSGSSADAKISNFKLYRIINDKKYLVLKDDFIDTSKFNSAWSIVKNQASSNAELVEESVLNPEEDPPLIYNKGELVLYNIYYDDYESDPSKKQYWQYTHTPFNDGLHPDNGKILNAPIERFYIDGKYVVKHWQEDSTGVIPYDKLSNQEEITFYVQGNASNTPEVTYIKTMPLEVKACNDYKIEIGVDDQDKDILNTKIELYKENRLIYTYAKDNVTPVSGVYPPIVSGYAPIATAGKYTVVATASDATGTGIRSYKFTVVSEGKIEGMVNHTDQWNENRKKYNLAKSGTEEKPRGYHVFWSGEMFMLKADTEGIPISVIVEILGTSYSTSLISSDGGITWKGTLWEESMMNKWGRYAPETLTFRFTAVFNGGLIKNHDVEIIVDNREEYWQLHRLF